MIKCGVCGSENEAAALFCGTCGSPLTPVEATAIADEAAKAATPTTTEPDEAVVPGKDRGARRDLGTGTETVVVPDPGPKPDPEPISDSATTPGGATITCGVCGTVNDATRTYCRKCANELKPAPPPPPPPPPPPVRRKISPLALLLGGGAILVAIALVAVLVMGGKPGATLAPSARVSPVAPTSTPGTETDEPTTEPTATERAFTETKLSGKIAFARCPADGSDCAIWLAPADKPSAARRIIGATNASALDPAISPDGKKIMYVVEPGLRLVTIATGTWVQQTSGAADTNPGWSRDGKVVTFAGHRASDNTGDDREIRIDGLRTSKDHDALTDNDFLDHDPVFTPDGKSIIYVGGEDDERDLEQIDLATGDIRDLTNDGFVDEDPAVSPDGTQVAFASKRGGDGSEYDLFILNLATLEITALPAMAGNENDPAWSPGGRYIVFSAGKVGARDLFILDLADMSSHVFTSAAGSDIQPSWR